MLAPLPSMQFESETRSFGNPDSVKKHHALVPPFVLSVLFAFACLHLVRADLAGFSAFFRWAFSIDPKISDLWQNLLFRSNSINGPAWSIWPEIVGSLFLPILVYLHRASLPRYQWPLFLGVSAVLAFTPVRYVLWFYGGFFLTGEVAKLVGSRRWAPALAFAAGLALLAATISQGYDQKSKVIIPSGIAAALMIGAVISSRDFMSWLEIRPLRFLGRVSYSFYLLHWPILYLSALIGSRCHLGNIAVLATSIAATLLCAAVSYRLIELPCIALGKLAGKRRVVAAL